MASVLFIDGVLPSFPHPNREWRVLRILQAFAEAGHRVVYLLLQGERYQIYRPAFEEAGIQFYLERGARICRQREVDCPVVGLDQLLQEIPFHLACIHFVNNALACIPVIRRHSPRTRIAVDTVDLAHLREWREAMVTGRRDLMAQAYRTRQREMYVFRQADVVIAVTPLEAEMIARMVPGTKTAVIPVLADPWPQVNPFACREGLLYVGNFLHQPNVDAVIYLVHHIWPYLQKLLPAVDLYIVGDNPPQEIRALSKAGIKVTGYVPALRPYLEQCRLMLAPVRYGAGLKTKIVEALAAGLPVVTTRIGAEGMELRAGENVVVADDPVFFSRAAAALYRDEALWDRLSRGGQEHVRCHYSFPVVAPAIYGLLLN
ncbi:glycosyltransferase [Desulfofundulus sp. TPOSR]|uniref:glycosyltransferase family 4 protein n=1 Tax=Desulfofundulus sp. TPOSR TaxID=2714340 RepID=UPI00140C8B73|nr:glycosyltransferase family 4 protein [Desulfofundulus sp. TPOSR]NHM26786.1 glycosyltransferase [Desulfofundulus sp. TPOSR]